MHAADSIVRLGESITDWWLRHDLFDPPCVFTNPAIFIEAYAIRGGLTCVRWLESQGRSTASVADVGQADGRRRTDGLPEDAMIRRDAKVSDAGAQLLAGAWSFCDRVVSHQGVQGPAEALMMGYGLHIRDGMVCHACVADQASVAAAVLETIALRPSHPRVAVWQAAMERWTDWVLANFAQSNGGIGVGIFGHKWNPIPEYWCATSLTTGVLFHLTRLTGNDRYRQAALAGLDWLARFDYRRVEIPSFTDCAPEVILYSAEGMVEGMRYLLEAEGTAAVRQHPVAVQCRGMAEWLVNNQSSEGRWPEPPERGYRDYSAGIPWHLLRMNELIGPEPTWCACAERHLAGLATVDGERYYGLYVRPFTSGLAWLSACTAAMTGGGMLPSSCSSDPIPERPRSRSPDAPSACP